MKPQLPQLGFSKSGSTFWIKTDSRVHGRVARRGNKITGYLVNPVSGNRFEVAHMPCNPANVVEAMEKVASVTAQAVALAILELSK